MGLFSWMFRRRREEQPPEEWFRRVARLESDMETLKIDAAVQWQKVRNGLALLGKRAKALEVLDDGDAPNGRTLTPAEEGRILREMRQRRR